MSELHVVTTISNPVGYRSRFKLYDEFARRMKESGVALHTIELATGDQGFAVTQAGHPRHIQVRTTHEIWYRENLLNVAISRLPAGWEYVAWVDADIAFARPDWIEATVAELRRHAFVQMFSHVVDLGPKLEPTSFFEGFVYAHLDDARRHTAAAAGSTEPIPRRPMGQPGFAWAARREALEAVGGILDWSILGANDYFMGLALVGRVTEQSTRMPGSSYAASLLRYQEKAETHVRRDLGYVDGTLLHYWHGRRRDRGYDTRWRILADHLFDPEVDLKKDAAGLYELTADKPGLRDAIRAYFRARNEDGVEV